MLDWLHNLKKRHIDDASDYQKGRRTGIAIGIGLYFALSVIVVYRTRHTSLYPEIRKNLKKHGHDLERLREPVVREEVSQIEHEIKKQLARDRRDQLLRATDHGGEKWRNIAATATVTAAVAAQREEYLGMISRGNMQKLKEMEKEKEKEKKEGEAGLGIIPLIKTVSPIPTAPPHDRDPFILIPPFTYEYRGCLPGKKTKFIV